MTEDSRAEPSLPRPSRAAASTDAAAPSAEAVAAYLAAHPDFFVDRDALLADLELPHGGPGAVSLVERQLIVLRERNRDMRGRLNDLIRTARTNHRIFERTLGLATRLVETDDAAALVRAFVDGLRDGFDVDAAQVSAIDTGGLPAAIGAGLVVTDEARAREVVGNLMRPDRIVCGRLRDAEIAFLFGTTHDLVASAAVMPVPVPGGLLLVALGSADAEHFTPDMGTLFIRFLGETLARRLTHVAAPAEAASARLADDSGAA